jgi:hypothetical protein
VLYASEEKPKCSGKKLGNEIWETKKEMHINTQNKAGIKRKITLGASDYDNLFRTFIKENNLFRTLIKENSERLFTDTLAVLLVFTSLLLQFI